MGRILEKTIIVKFNVVLVAMAAGLWLTASARADDTNTWPGWVMTRLQAAQTNTGRVMIQATSPVGVANGNSGTVTVKCKEITDVATGQKDYGISITLTEGQEPGNIVLIDYEEIEPLLNGIEYISKTDWSVTSLAGFDAFYTTKDGFRVMAFSRSRTGSIEIAVRSMRSNERPMLLMRDQLAQLRNLIEQARNKLDEIRSAK